MNYKIKKYYLKKKDTSFLELYGGDRVGDSKYCKFENDSVIEQIPSLNIYKHLFIYKRALFQISFSKKYNPSNINKLHKFFNLINENTGLYQQKRISYFKKLENESYNNINKKKDLLIASQFLFMATFFDDPMGKTIGLGKTNQIVLCKLCTYIVQNMNNTIIMLRNKNEIRTFEEEETQLLYFISYLLSNFENENRTIINEDFKNFKSIDLCFLNYFHGKGTDIPIFTGVMAFNIYPGGTMYGVKEPRPVCFAFHMKNIEEPSKIIIRYLSESIVKEKVKHRALMQRFNYSLTGSILSVGFSKIKLGLEMIGTFCVYIIKAGLEILTYIPIIGPSLKWLGNIINKNILLPIYRGCLLIIHVFRTFKISTTDISITFEIGKQSPIMISEILKKSKENMTQEEQEDSKDILEAVAKMCANETEFNKLLQNKDIDNELKMIASLLEETITFEQLLEDARKISVYVGEEDTDNALLKQINTFFKNDNVINDISTYNRLYILWYSFLTNEKYGNYGKVNLLEKIKELEVIETTGDSKSRRNSKSLNSKLKMYKEGFEFEMYYNAKTKFYGNPIKDILTSSIYFSLPRSIVFEFSCCVSKEVLAQLKENQIQFSLDQLDNDQTNGPNAKQIIEKRITEIDKTNTKLVENFKLPNVVDKLITTRCQQIPGPQIIHFIL